MRKNKQFQHVFDKHFHLICYALIDENEELYRWRVFDENRDLLGRNAIARITAIDKVTGGAFVNCGEHDGFIRKIPPKTQIGQLIPARIDRDLRNNNDSNNDKGLRLTMGWQWRTPHLTLHQHKNDGIRIAKNISDAQNIAKQTEILWQNTCDAFKPSQPNLIPEFQDLKNLNQWQLILSHNIARLDDETRQNLLKTHFIYLCEKFTETQTQTQPQILPPESPLWQAIANMPAINAPITFAERSLYNQAKTIFSKFAPELIDNCQLHKNTKSSLFANLAIDTKINQSLSKPYHINNGGELYIDECTAATLIDVNTASTTGHGRQGDEGICNFNLNTASEIARLIGLLDIAGVILVDFIRMQKPQSRKRLAEGMRTALRQCRINADVLGYSHSGLLEITRRRQAPSLLAKSNDVIAELTLCNLANSLKQNPNNITITANKKTIQALKNHYGKIIESHPTINLVSDDKQDFAIVNG